MKVEIGGGRNPLGNGFTNVDIIPEADIVHDLDHVPWPLEEDCATEIYSAHCFEHLSDPVAAFSEVARIGRIGARVVIKVPDPLCDLAMVDGHHSVLGEVCIRNLFEHFPEQFWPRTDKTLRIVNITRNADPTWFHRARACPLFERYSDQEILLWVPRTCHETVFEFEVVAL